MLISHRYQFIYLKTHKTAGTSVEVALEHLCAPPNSKTGTHYREELVSEFGVIGARGGTAKTAEWRNHMSARAIRSKTGNDVWRRYFRFTTIRNPYDRMVSMFWSRMQKEDRQAMLGAPFNVVRAQFRNWVGEQGVSNNLNKLMIGPLFCADHVLRYEHLAEDFAALTSELNDAPLTLPRLKADRRKRPEDWREYYDEESKKVVARNSAFELAYFGYDFDGGPYDLSPMTRARRLAQACPLRLMAAFGHPQQKAKKIRLNHLDAPRFAP